MPSDRHPAEPRKLHPLFLLFSLVGAARNLLLPGLIVLFAARGGGWELWAMLFFLPSALYAVVRYVRLRYTLAADEMIVTGGLLTRFERHIPYTRIQNINLRQNVFHRMFGIASVSVETAGGDEPEAELEALSMKAVAEIRHQIERSRPGSANEDVAPVDGVEAPPDPEPILELPVSEIVLAGLISNRGLAVVAAAIGIAWELELFSEERIERWTRQAQDVAPNGWSRTPLEIGILAFLAFVALVVLMRALSVAWMLVEYYGFTLARRDDDLQISYGLFTRVTATMPRRRVQQLAWRQSVLHRLAGRMEVQVVTAGGDADSDAARQRSRIAPILKPARLPEIIHEVQPQSPLAAPEWRPARPEAWRRVLVRSLIQASLVSAGLTVFLGPWALALVPALVPWLLLNARKWSARLAYAVTDGAVAFRRGWLQRKVIFVRFGKIQIVRLDQSPFDRRWDMATVSVDTAGGTLYGGAEIPYLDLAEARTLVDLLRRESASREFQW